MTSSSVAKSVPVRIANAPDSSPVWRIVARAIADIGAKRCFGLVGGANFKVTLALTDLGVEFIAARHEGGAMSMADVAARLTRELVVVSFTAGPGLTNAITGIGEAAKSDTPLLVLAGDVVTGDRQSAFAFNQSELVRAVGGEWRQIADPQTAYLETWNAAARAIRERKPVVLSLPIDVQEMPVMATMGKRHPPLMPRRSLNSDKLAELVATIRSSRRPLILAGHGAVVADAQPLLVELGDKLGALLATSVQAHGMFSGHPWNLGIAGGFSSPAAAELIAQSDVILAFGMSLNMWTTKKGRLIDDHAQLVQIDVEKGRIGKHRPVDLELEGDASQVATALLEALAAEDVSGIGWRTPEISAIIDGKSNRNAPYDDTSTQEHIDPRTLSKAMDDVLPNDRTVVVDGGHFVGWVARYLSVPDHRGWCIPIAFQSIGLGLAGAIGAAVTQPERLTVLAVGDGGFLMSIAELETAVRLKRRLCIFVYNDSAYSAEVHHFVPEGYSAAMAQFPVTDFAAIARGYGADGCVVKTLADLDAVKSWVAQGAQGVFIVDGRINPKLIADWYREIFGSANL
ncbi:thiamine pyrophosphate-binding protein [Rhodopseudomonas boonkerdii]|uniref:thiamine pyrophosphate-binding protein n=1 Tax=Rhodopseudomonas boonkerdii TaxID=475937 RepID=UPI001E5B2D91|nr:thiamine pyrophosphate-binding protein [Rhodopseudomonas boonkerdii]UGV27723.1 thiamine pyrophosphate-binding protein [Rhodopseudomonas boonkerdii]